MPSLMIVYASGSGHTKYVLDVLLEVWKTQTSDLCVTSMRAEAAEPEDLLKGDILLLGSGSWNTGGVEGQLHPYMYDLLKGRAKDADLKGKRVAIVALGDQRYFYTARAGEHLRSYVVTHGGKVLGEALTVVNQPYGQEAKVKKWGKKFLTWI